MSEQRHFIPEAGSVCDDASFFAHFRAQLDQEAFTAFLRELGGESDRSAAILAGAYLSDGLAELLRRRLLGGQQLKESLLGQEKPLGTFAARIKAAYAVGALNEASYHDLDIIRKIRNASAHEGVGFSFARAKIAALCEALSLFEAWPESIRADRSTPRLRFTLSVVFLLLIAIPGAGAIIKPIEPLVRISGP